MSRKRTSRQDRRSSATPHKSQIIIVVIVVVSLFAAWTMLAYSSALDRVFSQKAEKKGPVSLASFTSPSKEYIYAGGRLVATEEPASSGCVSPPSPGNTLFATAQTATSVVLNWAPSSGAHHYEVQRRPSIAVGTDWATLSPNPGSNTFTDNGVGVVANTAYLYRVRAVDAAGACPSSYSNIDLATTTIFTDDPLVAQMTIIQAVHLTQLRTAINAVRTTAALAAFNWTDPPATDTPAPGVVIKKDHIQKLRDSLNPALSALGLSAPGYTDPTLVAGSTPVKKIHVDELRQRVR
jgi:hypothetical protein